MVKSDERMDMISTAIRSQAEQQSRDLISKANTYRDTQLAQYTDQLIDSMYETVRHATEALRQRKLSDISQAEQDGYHALLRHREKLTATVFEGVLEQLRQFVGTAEYDAWLLQALEPYRDSWDHNASIVEVREADLRLAPKITALLPGCQVRADNTITPGGVVLTNAARGIRVDETLATRLSMQKPWFLQNCGMRLL